MSIFGRVPVIPISYNNKENAIEKELVVDYDTGNIYVVSPTDRSVLIDITSNIRSQLESIVISDNTEVTLDGIGTISLDTVLIDLLKSVDMGIEVVEEGSSNLQYYEGTDTIDYNSIESKNQKIQITSFDIAEELTIPRKKNGKIEWVPILTIAQDSNSFPGLAENEIDGEQYKVLLVEPTNDKIYLNLNKHQKTEYPTNVELNIILPDILDEYAKIDWILDLADNCPAIILPSKAKKEYNVSSIPSVTNSYYHYIFETYNYGETWMVRVHLYNK